MPQGRGSGETCPQDACHGAESGQPVCIPSLVPGHLLLLPRPCPSCDLPGWRCGRISTRALVPPRHCQPASRSLPMLLAFRGSNIVPVVASSRLLPLCCRFTQTQPVLPRALGPCSDGNLHRGNAGGPLMAPEAREMRQQGEAVVGSLRVPRAWQGSGVGRGKAPHSSVGRAFPIPSQHSSCFSFVSVPALPNSRSICFSSAPLRSSSWVAFPVSLSA
mmetsp:Transcript_36459/g.86588  ORF Transcript_36459/g.86588 Transcript_36459/m.86588 type:complete len:218 (+) Transcript_36459:60-713(+)